MKKNNVKILSNSQVIKNIDNALTNLCEMLIDNANDYEFIEDIESKLKQARQKDKSKQTITGLLVGLKISSYQLKNETITKCLTNLISGVKIYTTKDYIKALANTIVLLDK